MQSRVCCKLVFDVLHTDVECCGVTLPKLYNVKLVLSQIVLLNILLSFGKVVFSGLAYIAHISWILAVIQDFQGSLWVFAFKQRMVSCSFHIIDPPLGTCL